MRVEVVVMVVCMWCRIMADPDVGIEVTTSSGSVKTWYGMFASNGGDGSVSYPSKMTSLVEVENYGCDESDYGSVADVFYVRRGECTFAMKSMMAASKGARALIVGNNVRSLYMNETTGILKDACELNCGESSSDVKSQCQTECSSNTCILAENPSNRKLQYCCIKDEVAEIHINSSITIPTVFISVQSSSEIEELIQTFSTKNINIFERPVEFSWSVILILFIGVFTVALSSFRGSWRDRKRMLEKQLPRQQQQEIQQQETKSDDGNDEVPTTILTYTHVVQYLCAASFFLLFMFFLIKMGASFVTMFIIIIFCVTSFSSISFLVFEPALKWIAPKFYKIQVTSCVFPWIRENIKFSRGEIVVCFMSLSIVVTWFVERHTMWYLQNILGICVCCTFTVLVKLPNLSIATALLVLFLLYDIFMVFLSPFIFSSSVMLDVATAGGSDTQTSVQGSNECEISYGERMPMLFMVPRNDWKGGYTMLGLGDVIFPSLLVTFMLRVDYMTTKGFCQFSSYNDSVFRKIGYFPVLCFGYLIGLIFAFLANMYEVTINGVKGQPALLYLVPCTLGPAVLLAWHRGELKMLWKLGDDKRKDDAGAVVLGHNDGDDDDDEDVEDDGTSRLLL